MFLLSFCHSVPLRSRHLFPRRHTVSGCQSPLCLSAFLSLVNFYFQTQWKGSRSASCSRGTGKALCPPAPFLEQRTWRTWDPLFLGLCCWAGLDLASSKHQSKWGLRLPGREVTMCGFHLSGCFGEHHLLSLSSFLKSSSVPGDITEILVNGTLKVTL